MSKITSIVAIFAIIIIAALVYAFNGSESADSSAISYELNGAPVEVTTESVEFGYTGEQLLSIAQECGSEKDSEYFNELAAKFASSQKEVYTFTYTEEAQSPESYIVTVLPNLVGYESLDQFKADFDQCFAGGTEYPVDLNENSLLFVSACGTGFDDGSGNPIGCSEVVNSVEINLN